VTTSLLRKTEMHFGRHQTFTPRYTWIKSAYDGIVANPLLFTTHDAHRKLGVGKNMARSMRFWLQAAGLTRETDGRCMFPTGFGRFLTSNKGADAYLESDAAWWLLHWRFVGPGGQLPVWWIAFHAFQPGRFTVDSLTDHAATYLEAIGESASDKVLRRDVLAMVRNYVSDTQVSRQKADDVIDMPFAHLNVIRHDGDAYRFVTGPKRGLEPEVVLYASLDFLAAVQDEGNQPLVGRLALEAGGPGRAFRLTERDLSDLLRQAVDASDGDIAVRTLGGADQLLIDGNHDEVATRALWRMFRRLGTAEGDAPPELGEPLLALGMVKLFDHDAAEEDDDE
jgi:hypothetical protein